VAKQTYKTHWYDYLILSLINILLAVAITVRWFSYMIGDRSYAELGSSKSAGIAYAVGLLEKTNWRFVLVAFLLLLAHFYTRKSIALFRRKQRQRDK